LIGLIGGRCRGDRGSRYVASSVRNLQPSRSTVVPDFRLS
jgi:hypothetical protein